MMNRLFYYSLIIFFGTVSLWAGEQIDIYYTSSINGNLDGCECHAVPRAGMVSSAYFLRERNPDDSILIDLGDFLDVYPDSLLADNIYQVFDELDYDVLSLGDQEFTEGIDFLLEKRGIYPLMSNNLTINGEPFSPQPMIFEKNGKKIGIAGIIDSRVFYFHSGVVKEAISLESITESSERLHGELEEEGADAFVLLFHGSAEKARELFSSDDSWDALLFAHDQSLYEESDGADRFIASPGDNGNRVGILSLHFKNDSVEKINNEFVYFEYLTDPMDLEVKRRIDLYTKDMISRLQDD